MPKVRFNIDDEYHPSYPGLSFAFRKGTPVQKQRDTIHKKALGSEYKKHTNWEQLDNSLKDKYGDGGYLERDE